MLLLAAVAQGQFPTTLFDGVFGVITDKARGHSKYTWFSILTTTFEVVETGMTLDTAILAATTKAQALQCH